jgi:hypothetical protein
MTLVSLVAPLPQLVTMFLLPLSLVTPLLLLLLLVVVLWLWLLCTGRLPDMGRTTATPATQVVMTEYRLSLKQQRTVPRQERSTRTRTVATAVT